jgi:hypothetical protein
MSWTQGQGFEYWGHETGFSGRQDELHTAHYIDWGIPRHKLQDQLDRMAESSACWNLQLPVLLYFRPFGRL